METKELFRIKRWHRGLAFMLVFSLLLVTFTQFYESHGQAAAVSDMEPLPGAGTGTLAVQTDIITDSGAAGEGIEETSVLEQTAQELAEYSQRLEEADYEDRSLCLDELSENLEGYQEQVEAWNRDMETQLEEQGYQVLLARQKEFEAETAERFTKLQEQLQEAGSGEETEAVVQAVQDLLEGGAEEYVPIYGSALPSEVEEGSLEITEEAPEQAGAEYRTVQSAYGEDELCTEGLTALSEEMMQKAEELETPLQIYLYLKNHIHSELYYGSRKGAEAVWDSLAGNDKDQASLLIAMLRHQGYPARYVNGRIYLNAEQAMNLTGTEQVRQAAEVLTKLGTPVTLVEGKDGPVGIKLEHTWVEAYLPYGDYRGAGNNGGEAMWIPLDTFIKTYEDSDSVFDHLEEIGLTDESMKQMADAYGTEYYDQFMTQWEAPLNQLLAEHPDLTLLNRRIVPEELSYLPMSLPYSVAERKNTGAVIPANGCDRITFALNGTTLTTVTAAELYSHRLTITYLPAEEEDRVLLEQYGSVFQAPAHLLRLRAALMLDGEAIAYGEPLAPGSLETFTMDVYSGIQKDRIDNQLMAGGMYQITLDMQTMTEQELTEALAELEQASAELNALEEGFTDGDIYTDGKLGRLLDCAGKYYFAQVDIADRILAEYMGINATRTLSVGMTGYTVTPTVMLGTVVGLEEGSVYIDIDLDSHGVASLTGDKDAEKRYMLTTGMLSSAYESMIWEQLLGVEAVSTTAVMQQACEDGIEIYALCSRNYSEYRSKLHVKENVLAAVDSAIAAGMIVTIPAETIQMGDWKGTGYMVTNPDTMATAYMISGGLNGGYVQETVEMSFVGNALLYMLDIALCFGGIVNLLPLFAMGPVGIVIGVGLVILASIAINAAFNALGENYRMMDAYIRGESNGDEIVEGFVWNSVLTVTALGLSQCIDLGIEIGRAHAAERYLNGVIGPRLTEGLLSEGLPPSQVAKAVKQMRNLGYTDDFIRELADNISAEQLIRMSSLSQKGLGQELLDTLLRRSKKLGNYSDDLIWQLERAGNYTDDILKLVDDYGEAFTRQIGTDDLSRLGRLVNEGLTDDVVDAVIKHADNFADYSDNTIRKIAESGGNAERILTQIDNYAKDFTEDLTAGQLKRLDDILEQGVTPEQFEVLVKHGKQIENYTDEIVGLWRNYSGNGDDFLKLVDDFGDEFVEAFQKSGDEAVEIFNEKIKEVTVRLFDAELDKGFLANSAVMKNRLPEWACNTGNFAYCEVNIAIVDKKQYFSHSSINSMIPSVEGSGISVKPESSPFNPMYVNSKNIINGEGAWLRDVDTEYKILSEVQSRLGSNFEATGSIKLYTELEPCLSCQSVIKKFKEMYPNIRIEIIYSKGV